MQVRAPVMLTVPVVHPVSAQYRNSYPSAGSAVNWTVPPPPNGAEQEVPQSIPLGVLVTQLSSLPSPVFWMVRV